MRPRNSAQPQPSNSICKSVGHDWKVTVSQTYRRCQREHCQAAERLVNGQWRNATIKQPPARRPVPAPASPSILWDSASLAGTDLLLDRPQPLYPGYDPAAERLAFHRYRCLSSGKPYPKGRSVYEAARAERSKPDEYRDRSVSSALGCDH